MRRLTIAILTGFISFTLLGQDNNDALKQGFENPPSHVRPQIWWHWMNGNITKDGIRKDIEWFKRIGLGGFHVFDASFSTPQVVEERLVYMTEQWQDAFRYAIDLADSLGLDVTIPSSPGFSSTGGPWVKPEEAMKKIVWREMMVKGGRKIKTSLPDPYTITGKFQNYGMKKGPSVVDSGQISGESYSDIAVIAVRLPDDYRTLSELGATVSSSGGSFTLEQLTNGDLSDTGRLPAGEEGYSWIQYSFPKPQTIRSLAVINDIVR
ncbi:MAG: glycoside hydrolase family 2, partial [Bacteroidales bacterium]|nr:glycoside hydrolase family 2 [Bacteroidales bacterium]